MSTASTAASSRADAPVVRPEYQAMVDGYPVLLREFGCTISAHALADLGILMSAIERIDRILDGTSDPAARASLSASILVELVGNASSRAWPSHEVSLGDRRCDLPDATEPCAATEPRTATNELRDATTELRGATAELRVVALRRGVLAELTAIAREALANTERMRQAIDRDDYLGCVVREGELTVELALLIAPLDSERATAFLRAVAAPANLLDKLVDLRGDHRRGEVAVHPGLRTHAQLVTRLVRGAWAASALHPNRLRFTSWGLRWLISGHR